MRYSALATVLIGLSALCSISCSVQRKATEVASEQVSSFRFQESRDSLREEISQNLNENLSEHEVVTWTVTGLPLTAYGLQERDTVKVERVTDRTKLKVSSSKFQDSKDVVRTVRDTVYIERKDSIEVQEFKAQGSSGSSSLSSQPSTLNCLKWIFFIIIAIIGLIITIKVCWRRF